MEIPVLDRTRPVQGLSARSGEPFGSRRKGRRAKRRCKNCAIMGHETGSPTAPKLISVVRGPFQHPWARFAGTWALDDPLIAEWQKEVEEYRRRMDEDPNIP